MSEIWIRNCTRKQIKRYADMYNQGLSYSTISQILYGNESGRMKIAKWIRAYDKHGESIFAEDKPEAKISWD